MAPRAQHRARKTRRRLPLGLALALVLFVAWRWRPTATPATASLQASAGSGGSDDGSASSIGGRQGAAAASSKGAGSTAAVDQSKGSSSGGSSSSSSGGGSSGTGDTNGAQGSSSGSGSNPASGGRRAPPRVITEDKPLLFFDVGGAYHHLPRCAPGWETPGFGCDATPCPVPWDYTTDRSAADAIIYNTLNGMTGWGAGKVREREDQWVVMWAMESGKYYPAIYDAKANGADINADYRLDVEVPVPYYTEWELPNINATPVAFADKRKDALIGVFISNCGALNNRGEVLEKLIQLLPGQVHSYGQCSHNRDESQEPRHQHGNLRVRKNSILPTYKFAFTPENSNDPGYVTEKLYQGLEAGAIPIYIGAPDVNRVIPVPEAIIKVEDFASVEDLVEYIKKVAEDETLWEKHMGWKKLPQSKWSKEWQEFKRMTQYSAHCRTAMHIGGKPWRWRDADQ